MLISLFKSNLVNAVPSLLTGAKYCVSSFSPFSKEITGFNTLSFNNFNFSETVIFSNEACKEPPITIVLPVFCLDALKSSNNSLAVVLNSSLAEIAATVSPVTYTRTLPALVL